MYTYVYAYICKEWNIQYRSLKNIEWVYNCVLFKDRLLEVNVLANSELIGFQ